MPVFNKTENEAVKKYENRPEDEVRFRKFLNALFCMCELAGYHLEERVVLKDVRTGKIWR